MIGYHIKCNLFVAHVLFSGSGSPSQTKSFSSASRCRMPLHFQSFRHLIPSGWPRSRMSIFRVQTYNGHGNHTPAVKVQSILPAIKHGNQTSGQIIIKLTNLNLAAIMIPQILTMISSEGEQWGRYNLPRNIPIDPDKMAIYSGFSH